MIIGLPAIGFFMIYDFIQGGYLMGLVLFLMFALLLGLFFLIRKPTYKEKENLIYRFFPTTLFFLFGFYLVYTIGLEGNLSQTPWAFLFAVLVFFALGAGRALIWVAVLYLALLTSDLYFLSNGYVVVQDLRLRFYIAFLLVIIASFFFERLKKKYQLELIDNQGISKESQNRYREAYEKLSSAMKKRKRAEEALKESKENYRALLEDMPALVCRFLPDGTLSFVNNSYCRYFDKTREELVGENFFQFIPKPEREQVRKHFESLTFEKPVISYDHQVFAPAGEIRWQRWTDRALFDEKNRLYQYQSIGIDITDSKRIEEALRESEVRFRELAELMPETIFEANLEGKLTFVNRKAFENYGYAQEDFERGLTSFDMIASADRDQAIKNFRRILNGENLGINEYIALRKDGSTFPVMIHSAAIIRDGSLIGLRGFVIDITDRKHAEEERKKLEAQFQQAQRLETIGTLAGGIAHDFNNLLMTIQGNASLMLFDVDISHPHYEALKNIEKQVERGAKLTSQLLGYARKGKYHVKPLDLNHIVRESSNTFGRTRKEISIQLDLEKNVGSVEADQGQIEQILYNLYVNAADAMPGGGKLFLQTANVTHRDIKSEQYDPSPGSYVRLTVSDSGTGIDEEIRDRIFDPFFSTKEAGKGSGLGLASVYGIVKSHNGYIEVESKMKTGTTFSIYLPTSEKQALRAAEFVPRIVEGSETILLVDDEKLVLEVGAKVLEKMGYTVLVAQSGREAIDIFGKNKDDIDLVILDMIMPDMGGGETYDRIKQINSRVKVILSSGYSINGQAGEIMKRGCNGFIQKPFKANELSEKLKEILGT
jgi:two-component system cell cycle sensor histidine kinase/response regulator CckA